MEVGLSSSSLHLRMPCGRVCVTSGERDFSPLLIFSLQVVLNQKFTDCFVLVFLDSHLGKTSLTVVFREPFPVQPQDSESPPAQLVSTYHHLESVINTACFTLWTRLL